MTALAVRRAGGAPVRVTPMRQVGEDPLTALIIGGGTDVDPIHYGEESLGTADGQKNSLADWTIGLLLTVLRTLLARHQPQPQDYDPARDDMEKHLIRHALYTGKPLLGICRGAQLINVTLGGSLHQSIDHFYSEGTGNPRSILPRKRVALAQDSRLRHILGGTSSRVNALHDQSIRDLGDDLRVSARESNGVVQAIERDGEQFLLGVQWHPEYLPQYPAQQQIFRHLVRAAQGQSQ
ncbi:MAG: gamma-glutamyl-gamma-aminobutyrate hydrolase family protein [Halioglobus sp.]